jgi:transcriptional regulator with XRE-family HTH domain
LSQQQLAEKAGISKPYLSQLESGKRNGTTDILQKLAQALNVSIEELVDSSPEPEAFGQG